MDTGGHIIVTGGAGFIGYHITARLLSEGYKVTVLDNLSTGKKANIPRGADFIHVDLGQEASYERLKDLSASALFHLAGQSSGEASFRDPLYDLRSHVLSTFWLLEWCKRRGVRRFVYAGSMGVYGDPHYMPVDENHPLSPKSFYAAAKASAEAYVRLYQTLDINTTIFRIFNAYGPGQNMENRMQGMASIYMSFMLEGKPVIVKGSKDRFRDFIYIDDLTEAWHRAWNNPVTYGKTYNLASGRKATVEEVLNTLKEIVGNKEYPVEYNEGTPGDQFGIVADIRRITNDLGWNPATDLRTGLRNMFESERARLSHCHGKAD